jgi:hypothetical protein
MRKTTKFQIMMKIDFKHPQAKLHHLHQLENKKNSIPKNQMRKEVSILCNRDKHLRLEVTLKVHLGSKVQLLRV